MSLGERNYCFFCVSIFFLKFLSLCSVKYMYFFKWQKFKRGFGSDSQPNAVLTLQLFKHVYSVWVQ